VFEKTLAGKISDDLEVLILCCSGEVVAKEEHHIRSIYSIRIFPGFVSPYSDGLCFPIFTKARKAKVCSMETRPWNKPRKLTKINKVYFSGT
jgi:hypothetical protein